VIKRTSDIVLVKKLIHTGPYEAENEEPRNVVFGIQNSPVHSVLMALRFVMDMEYVDARAYVLGGTTHNDSGKTVLCHSMRSEFLTGYIKHLQRTPAEWAPRSPDTNPLDNAF
jgi:hypothetical protein